VTLVETWSRNNRKQEECAVYIVLEPIKVGLSIYSSIDVNWPCSHILTPVSSGIRSPLK